MVLLLNCYISQGREGIQKKWEAKHEKLVIFKRKGKGMSRPFKPRARSEGKNINIVKS